MYRQVSRGELYTEGNSNLEYWHPVEFISLLSKAWSFYHQAADEYTKKLLLVPLLKLTKYFSYADEKVHKLYKSKYAKGKVERLLKEDYKALFYSLLEKELGNLEQRLKEYQSLNPKKVNCKVKAGVDVLEEDLEEPVNILITSPPYLQAQEYIRITKLELFWLGFMEDYIRNLTKKEIPYRDVPKVEIFLIHTMPTEHLLRKNIIEHMEGKGDWVHERTYIDKVVSRVMFSTKKNPATGIEDQRMDKEYLVVLKRR
jgi:hypothetical protein